MESLSINGLLVAKASGAEVIVTSSSDEKLARTKALGADHLINYRTTPDWDLEVLRLTHRRGADIIFENCGAQTTAKSFNCVRFGGLVNAIGYVSGKVDPAEDRMNINVQAIRKNLTLVGMLNGPKDRLEEMLAFYESTRSSWSLTECLSSRRQRRHCSIFEVGVILARSLSGRVLDSYGVVESLKSNLLVKGPIRVPRRWGWGRYAKDLNRSVGVNDPKALVHFPTRTWTQDK